MTTTAPPARAAGAPTPVRRRGRMVDLALVLALVLVVGRFALEPVLVPTASMEPTLHAGSHVLVDHVGPLLRGYHRGDVVLLDAPDGSGLLVKRVAAVAGEDVAILDGVLTVDGVPVEEPWVDPGDVDSVYAELGRVPADHVVVLADHRPDARDSRTFGPVAVSALHGRVVATVWPLGALGGTP
ncbi:signal peptidase I [Phycicoccus sp. MAQZ13P-2]|uniref:signal peptidase I n=1 Tax=Phycicoccus mangrovi TaxID=2840470 RepID=UPI001BFFE8F8|nr:signal peptidase I [Phycicoccus mangrovi]MBT9258066.1 signal peptidase I [Phycicoccus mangrovi]MBT9276277.1 signal peptidase I [Phycicoccus mangrovi]